MAGRGGMQVIELSNHPADMLSAVSLRRQAADQRAHDRHEDALVRHQASVQAIRVKRDRARARRRWWTWLRLAFAVGAEKRRAPRPQPRPAGDSGVEEKIKAGIAGEERVAAELSHALGADWTLLRGYRNRRGEIDDLLLGPTGLFAIEVKNINATVHVDGDRWQGDKYDNYGNLVEQRLIADRRGPLAQRTAQRARRRAAAVPARPRPAGHDPARGGPRSPPVPAGPGRPPRRPRRDLDRRRAEPGRRLRRPDRPRPASRAGTAHPPGPRLPRAHPAPGPPPLSIFIRSATPTARRTPRPACPRCLSSLSGHPTRPCGPRLIGGYRARRNRLAG